MAGALTAGLIVSSAVSMAWRLPRYRDYNSVTGRLEAALAEQEVTRGAVLLRTTRWYDWGEAGRRLPPDPMTAPLVFLQCDEADPALDAVGDLPLLRLRGTRLVPVERQPSP